VPSDPTNICHAPVDVLGMDILDLKTLGR
jgi:hypothetical protein